MSCRYRKNKKKSQKGGGSTDYAQSFYAPYADPAQLSRYTLHYIDKAPMFNPLETETVIPTGTSGIIPTGTYYDAIAPLTLQNSIGPPTAEYAQLGGSGKNKNKNNGKPILYVTKEGKQITHPWIAHVFKYADKKGMTYGQALKDSGVRRAYKKRN